VAVRTVRVLPDGVLTSPARKVGRVDEQARALAVDLLETMRASPACVGLAATQIGVPLRAFAIDVTGHKKARSCHGEVVLFDPEIIAFATPEMGREGCMSVPDLTGDVERATVVTVAGLDPDGRETRADGGRVRGPCGSTRARPPRRPRIPRQMRRPARRFPSQGLQVAARDTLAGSPQWLGGDSIPLYGPGGAGSVNSDSGADADTDVIVPSAGEPPNSGPSFCGTAENDASTPLEVMHQRRVAPFCRPCRSGNRPAVRRRPALLVCEVRIGLLDPVELGQR
jgi:peptide deformylase